MSREIKILCVGDVVGTQGCEFLRKILSDFKRKNVTIQAIHNELIKDPRFVLIGRGIYALDSWGYKKGTVSDIIVEIMKKAKKPLTREEIVKEVLHARKVKETTILLNLQNKNLFIKVDKNSYTLAYNSVIIWVC